MLDWSGCSISIGFSQQKLGSKCESEGHRVVTKGDWRANCSRFRFQNMRLSRDPCPATSVSQISHRWHADVGRAGELEE